MGKKFEVVFGMSDGKEVDYSYKGNIEVKWGDGPPGQVKVIDAETEEFGFGGHVRVAVLHLVEKHIINMTSQIDKYNEYKEE